MVFLLYNKNGDYMKKKYIVKKSSDFTTIIKKSTFFRGKGFVIYIKDSEFDYSRFGISVSKKVGNAVIRNKVKRQLRSIIDASKKNYQKNLDYIIIVKNGFLDYSFQEIKDNYEVIIRKING